MLRRTSLPGTFNADDFLRYCEAWAQPGALTAGLSWYRALRLGAPANTGPVRVPVRVIWGDHDAFLDRDLAEAGAALCDTSEVFHLPRASPWVQHEEAPAVNRLLLEFLG
jgi:pimeloyl-ACP methyl ester carboxylesterase